VERKRFEQLVEEALAQLPVGLRAKLENIAVLVEDAPRRKPARGRGKHLLGMFQGVPRTKKSVFQPTPPDRIILYQKNIEAICGSDAEIREQVRLTVWHECGHYFGLSEEELRHL